MELAEACGGKTGESKVGVGADALAGIASKKLPNPRVTRLERVVRGPGLFNPVDVHRNDIADDGRPDYVPIVQAIVGAAHVSQIGKLSKRAVPPYNLHVRCRAGNAPGKALITCCAMGRAGESEKYLEFLIAGCIRPGDVRFSPGFLVRWKSGEMGV